MNNRSLLLGFRYHVYTLIQYVHTTSADTQWKWTLTASLMMLLWQLIFNPVTLFQRNEWEQEIPLCGAEGAGWNVSQQMKWLWSLLGIFLLTMLDVTKSVVISSRALTNNALSDGHRRMSYSGRSRCGLQGLGGLMAWAVLTSAIFASSPHRLIFRHPKYSATCHLTMDRQPHLNVWNSTRESPIIHAFIREIQNI